MADPTLARIRTALDPWAPDANPDTVTIGRADADDLISRFTLLCESSLHTDHHDCQHCGATICNFCSGTERAGCPDRHAFEDHCLGCVGECGACKGAIL